MTKYETALDLIRALDQHRLLAQVRRNTFTDSVHVQESWYRYRRASGRA